MPFVNGTTLPYEIIRRPSAGEDATSALGQSREYNLAQIHVLLSDDPADLPGGAQSTERPAGECNASDGDREPGLDTEQSLWDFDSHCQHNAWGAIIWQLYLVLRRRLERVSGYDQLPRDVLPLKASAKATPLSSDWPYFPKKWTPPASQALDSNCTLLCPSSATTSAPLSPLSSTTNGPLTTISSLPSVQRRSGELAARLSRGAAPISRITTMRPARGTAVTSNATALAAGPQAGT